MTLLEQLKNIREHGPRDPTKGICGNIERDDIERFLVDIAGSWPKHSGNHGCPVPDPSGSYPVTMFIEADGHEMWSPEHPYGALRLELLDYCIAQLEAENGA